MMARDFEGEKEVKKNLRRYIAYFHINCRIVFLTFDKNQQSSQDFTILSICRFNTILEDITIETQSVYACVYAMSVF